VSSVLVAPAISESAHDPRAALPARPSAVDTVRATGTLSYRGLLKIRHHPQRLFDVLLLPVISTWLFANVFGGAIEGSVGKYLHILVPGVMVTIAVTSAVGTGVQLCEDIDKGVFDRFRSLPIARVAPLVGALLADIVRYVIATVMTVATGVALGYRPHHLVGLAAACVLVVICAFALSWIFAYLGVRMHSPSTVQGVSMLALTPLTFLSSALVPAGTFHGFIRTIANANPVSHICDAIRALINYGQFDVQIVWSLVGVALVLAVMVPLTVRAYIRKV
jgi:ABC-2 type transport system permease protein